VQSVNVPSIPNRKKPSQKNQVDSYGLEAPARLPGNLRFFWFGTFPRFFWFGTPRFFWVETTPHMNWDSLHLPTRQTVNNLRSEISSQIFCPWLPPIVHCQKIKLFDNTGNVLQTKQPHEPQFTWTCDENKSNFVLRMFVDHHKVQE
jgi:hypothetical protein